MTTHAGASARVAEAQEFVVLALEGSLYLASGPDYGLTLEELGHLAVRLGRNKAHLVAATNGLLDAAHLTRTSDRRLRLLPGDWRFTRFIDGYFTPERRPMDALDAVVGVLRDQTALTRIQLVAEAVRPLWGCTEKRLALALEILILAGVIREGDGVVQLTSEHLEGPLPSEILRLPQARPLNAAFEQLFSGVGALLQERRERSERESNVKPNAETPGSADVNATRTGTGAQVTEPKTKSTNILFLDVAGWSKLGAHEIHSYVTVALPELRRCLGGQDFQNTWGDAVVATFGSAKDAAESALRIRDFFRRGTPPRGVAPGLTCRISLHQGEVLVCWNPLIERDDIFGEAVHLAARLEPATVPGFVFCTQSFAHALRELGSIAPKTWPLGKRSLPKGHGDAEVFVVTDPNDVDPRPQVAVIASADANADDRQ